MTFANPPTNQNRRRRPIIFDAVGQAGRFRTAITGARQDRRMRSANVQRARIYIRYCHDYDALLALNRK